MCINEIVKDGSKRKVRFSLTSDDVRILSGELQEIADDNARATSRPYASEKQLSDCDSFVSNRKSRILGGNSSSSESSLEDNNNVSQSKAENRDSRKSYDDKFASKAATTNQTRTPTQSSHPGEMKKSLSFAGFGFLKRASFSSFHPSFSDVTRQELDSMVHPTKREPSKISKQQIKEYANKYKHLQKEEREQNQPWYKVILEYTQPAHLVTIIAFIYLAFRLFPDSSRRPSEASTLTRLLYVSSISAVFGSQFWMTFVSGIALFFTVPRHVFAQVQSVLFPLYFLTNSAFMLVTIVAYTRLHPTHLWDAHQMIQGGMLVLSFIINLGIRLYLSPVLSKLITIKMAIESETGLGNEVGNSRPGILSRCPHYMRLYKAFRRIHIAVAIGNMASMAATSLHLYYLATKLCSAHL